VIREETENPNITETISIETQPKTLENENKEVSNETAA